MRISDWSSDVCSSDLTEPGETSYRIANPSFRNENDYGKWYIAGNVVEGNVAVSKDNWNGGVQTEIPLEKIKLDKPWPSMPIDQQTAEEAYKLVLAKAGAILPERDEVDARIIEETRSGLDRKSTRLNSSN